MIVHESNTVRQLIIHVLVREGRRKTFTVYALMRSSASQGVKYPDMSKMMLVRPLPEVLITVLFVRTASKEAAVVTGRDWC